MAVRELAYRHGATWSSCSSAHASAACSVTRPVRSTGWILVYAVIVPFLWHAALRIFRMLHDFGVYAGMLAKLVHFGLPLLCTVAMACSLLTIVA